jgi:amino acid adenylation domain-containing protein
MQFKNHSGKTALSVQGNSLSYSDLDRKSNILANYLLDELKVCPNDIIAVMTDRNENLIIGIVAILKTGSAYLPVNPDYPETRKKFMLEDSGCNLVLTDDMVADQPCILLSINRIISEAKYSAEALDVKVEVNQTDPAYIIYTSGSTGRPKGVVVNHKNLLRLFFNDENIFGFNENDVWTLFHSYSFDFSVWEIFGALLFGGRLVIVPDEIRKDPLKYYDLLAFENVTVLNQTPSAFYRLLPDNDRKLSVRYVIFGGESLQPQKLKDWKLNYPDINFINMYGITETTVHVTYKEITDENINSIISNIGKPIPTLGLCILDSNFTMFPKGISGQICVYGEGLASGYLNQPELTSEKFKYIYPFGLCYLSGDLGRILENGDIEYLGRMDDQVQFHGFRIELSEIERALICVAEIKEAVVLAVKKDNDLSLHAFLVTTYKMTIDHIRRELAKYIPDYMIPSSFLFVDAIPLTPNGKTDKKALLNLKQSGSKKTLRPANKYEEIILETWKTTLGDIEISTDESFFGVGGDSIKALKLVREINKKLNTGLTIAGLYENDTIIKLAERTANKSDSVFEDEIRNELKRIEDSSDELIRNNTLTESIEQILPMSDIQRGMVYYSLKNPGSSVYHDQFVYQAYIKDFSLDIYLISLNLMIKKHSMLRTSFNLVDYIEDVQLIHRNIQPDLQFEDISGKSRAVIEKTVNDYVITERSMKFDITSPPLCRMKIFKAPEDIVILCWSFHHALLDGWSNASFITELLSFYKNILNNALYKSDLLRSSYLHYIAEQNVQKRNNEAVKFWENELAGYKRLEFPKKETDNITSLVYEYSLQIDPRIVSQLKVIASDLGTDIKTIFFSAYLCCISLLTYDNDILVGIVTNNRPVTDDSEKILGCFLNTIPFRINVDSSQTWKEYILSVVSKLNIQKKYEVLSLFEIVKHIDSPSGDSNPLFDVFFNYVDFNVYENIYEDFSLEKRGIKEYNLNGFGKTNTSLDFTVSNTFNKCALQITFDPENISYNWAKRLGDYYKRLLLLIAGETGEQKAERIHSILNNTIFDSPIRLKDIPLIDKSDIFQFSCYNNTRKQYTEEHLTIIHLYNEQLKTKKNQIALLLSDNSIDPITYSIFDENVNKLAAKILDNRNNKPGGLIGVISERNESMIYAVMAVIKSGNGYVPVDPYFPEERIKYMIEDSGCEVILCERKFKDYTRNNFPGEVIVIEDALAENLPSKEIIFPHVSESGPLFLLYTSGSTGRPKGVLMSHRPVLNLFLWMHYEYPVENERILLINPFTFDMSTWGLFAWAVNGSSVCILKHGDEKDPAKICKAVQEMSVTSIHIVPSMLSMFLDYIEKHSVNMAETQLKYIFVAGEVLFKHLIDKFNKCFKDSKTELINLYGPTEGHVDIYFRTNELDDIKHATVPIGRPIYNTKALIVDTEMRVVPPGILGEILLGGDCLADGYINKTTLTSNKFITLKNDLTVGKERFYRTGDIGRWLSDGNIEFLGRNDFQIKIRGFRVEPDEVQTLINGITGVKDSLVVGSELTPGEKSLIAYIVYESKDIYDEGFIRNELKKQVSDYMVPSVFVGIEKFPLSPNGKIDRKLLPEPRVSKQHKNIATPRNKLEEKISGIWREVLKTDTFGINDNFFDIGGHSLLIIRVQNELEKVINIKIEIVDLFNYPTIALLSDFLKKGNQDDLVIEKAAQRGENQRKARETRSLNTKRRRN